MPDGRPKLTLERLAYMGPAPLYARLHEPGAPESGKDDIVVLVPEELADLLERVRQLLGSAQ